MKEYKQKMKMFTVTTKLWFVGLKNLWKMTTLDRYMHSHISELSMLRQRVDKLEKEAV